MASFNNSFNGALECSCGKELTHDHKFCPRCGEKAAAASSFFAPSSFVSSLGRKRVATGDDSDDGSEVADCGQDDLLEELQENERLTERITELERLKAELSESWLQRHQELEKSIDELHIAEQEEAEAVYQASLEAEAASAPPSGAPSPTPLFLREKQPMAAILAEQVKEIVQSEHHLKDEEDFAHLVEERAKLRKEFQAGEDELERRRAKVADLEHQLELQQRALEESRLELEKERDAENAKVEMLRSEAARLRGGRGRCLTGNLAAELMGGDSEDGSEFDDILDDGGLAGELCEAEDAVGPQESAPLEEVDNQSAGEPEATEHISPLEPMEKLEVAELEPMENPQTFQPPHSDGATCSELHEQSTGEPLESTERTSPRESVESPQTQQPEHSNGTTCSELNGPGVVEQVNVPEAQPGVLQTPQPVSLDAATLERARALGLYDAVRRQCYQCASEPADPSAQQRDAREEGDLPAPPRTHEVPDGAVAHARALGLGDAVRGLCYQRALGREEAAAQEPAAAPPVSRRVSFAAPSGPARTRLDTEAPGSEDEEEPDTETAPQDRDLRRVSTYSLEDRYDALATMAEYVQVRVSNASEAPDAEDLRELWEVFQACDANGDGSINLRELIKVCRERPEVAAFFGLPSEIQQESDARRAVMEFFQGADADNDRGITWEELCRTHRERARHGAKDFRHATSCLQPPLIDRRLSTCSLEARYDALSPKGGALAVEDRGQEAFDSAFRQAVGRAGKAVAALAKLDDGTAPVARAVAVVEAEEKLARVRSLLEEARASADRLREEADAVERRRADARDAVRAKEERLRCELEAALGRLRERRAPQPEASWWSMFGAAFCCSRPAPPPLAGEGAPTLVALAGAADDGAPPEPAGPGGAPSGDPAGG